MPVRLRRGEKIFIVWGGLKGAVPILLGALAVLAGVDESGRIYGIIFVVVLFSVFVQGGSIPCAAARLHVPFRTVDYDLGRAPRVRRRRGRLRERDDGSDELPLAERAWVGVLVRDGRPQAFGPETVLDARRPRSRLRPAGYRGRAPSASSPARATQSYE